MAIGVFEVLIVLGCGGFVIGLIVLAVLLTRRPTGQGGFICPGCGKQLAQRVEACPACGRPMAAPPFRS